MRSFLWCVLALGISAQANAEISKLLSVSTANTEIKEETQTQEIQLSAQAQEVLKQLAALPKDEQAEIIVKTAQSISFVGVDNGENNQVNKAPRWWLRLKCWVRGDVYADGQLDCPEADAN